MPSSTIDLSRGASPTADFPKGEKTGDHHGSRGRLARLKSAVQSARPGICPERALLWTEWYRDRKNRAKPPLIQIALALRHVLLNKTTEIYPDEIIVGNFSSRRVGGSLYPELHGLVVMEDLLRFSTRRTNPLELRRVEAWKLLKTVPFWLFRFLAIRAHPTLRETLRFLVGQLRCTDYLINESAGIAHLAPDYAKLVRLGTEGIVAEAMERSKASADDGARTFYEAVAIAGESLASFGERYADLARNRAKQESDPRVRRDLEEIARVCCHVPRKGARTFREAVQSIFFAQVAINLESLDNAICPGRLDQILWPYYQREWANGRLTPPRAKEILTAFCIKMSEIIPVFSQRLTRFHGGMFNGQVVTVGGVDEEGRDATNELTYIFLEIMDELRMRQPNFHARMHEGSPVEYRSKTAALLARGGNSPALYNDDVIVPALCGQGYEVTDARNYTGVGCVEPVVQGKSFASTDAALCNVPILLELALNEGKRFGAWLRSGAKTPPVSKMTRMADIKRAFQDQLQHRIGRLIKDLHAIERANRALHPTPLTSMLLEGCLESGVCSTAGGAKYNFSGIQCVGPVDTGDALYAIQRVVFAENRLGLKELVDLLNDNLKDETWFARLRGLPKFGNDCAEVDVWTAWVVDRFVDVLEGYSSTRGGKYVAGIYSVTIHQHFGSVTGAMAHGRQRGASFASGMAPVNGMDKKGPTALFNSANRLKFQRISNGVNFNVKFDTHCLRGNKGPRVLESLLRTFFRRGGMQVQVNVVDPAVLLEARDHPERYPNLLVRVSGYSAYFNDLTPEMKDEIIQRSCLTT